MFEGEDVVVEYVIDKRDVERVRQQVREEYRARLDLKGDRITIAYPLDNFNLVVGGLPQLMNLISIMGATLTDLHFPKGFEKGFSGPKLGLEGLRRILGTTKSRRVHLGMRIDYQQRMRPEDVAKKIYQYGKLGLDFFTDDRDLVNQGFCPLQERVALASEAIDRLRREHEGNVLYAANITTRADRVLDAADDALDAGANMLMLDVSHGDFSGISAIAEDPSIKAPLHVQISRTLPPTISPLVVTKLARLCGGDQVFIDTDTHQKDALLEPWGKLKPSLPIVHGGVDLKQRLGSDLGIKLDEETIDLL